MAERGVCTGCGTSLPDADALGLITCSGCGQVTKLAGSAPDPARPPLQGWPAPPVAAPHPGGQWSAPAPVAGAPTAPPAGAPTPSSGDRPSRASRSSRASGASKAGRRVGCAIAPVIVVVVFGMVLFGAIRSCDIDDATTSFTSAISGGPSILTLSGSGTVLPGEGADADVVLVTQQTDESVTTRRVARIGFTASGSELRWESEALASTTSRAEIVVVGDTLFAGSEDQLFALDAATGKTRWRTTLRDKLTVGCPDCFAAVQGRLVVRTTDAYLTAYGTRSSESLWSKRLNSTSGSTSVVGDRLFVVDDPEDASALTPVALVDPANGKTIRSTTPRCPKTESTPWDLELSAGDEVLAVPGSKDVVAAFGFGDGCVVRWDPATGTIRWTSRLTGFSGIDDEAVVTGERDLVLGSSGAQIVTVYLPNGKARQLQAPGDVQATPTQIVGRTLVALTVTTRGTPRCGMAAWDLATGERTWANASLGTAQPVSTNRYHSSDALFDGTPRSLVVPTDDGLNVFTFEGTDRTFTVAPLDLATGDLGTELRRAFLSRYDSGTPSLTVEGESGDRLIVSIDNLLQSIPVSGKGEIVSFPEKE